MTGAAAAIEHELPPKERFLAKVMLLLQEQLDAGRRRRALGFYLRGWSPQGAAVQLRLEAEPA